MNKETPQSVDFAYSLGLAEITQLAKAKRVQEIAQILELEEADVQLSLQCVGDELRKGSSEEDSSSSRVSHFAHMVRVAYMVKHFFPYDIRSRRLAMLHDIKEEALPDQEETFASSDLAVDIDLLTEQPAELKDLEFFTAILPNGFDPVYFAKYRKFIADLHLNWDRLGALELCDRLDASTSASYLLHPKYASRLQYKALESLGRVWATLAVDTSEISQIIKNNYRAWFNTFGITEEKVEASARIFLLDI